MSEQETLRAIAYLISEKPIEDQESIAILAEYFRMIIEYSPNNQAKMAFALVGAEMAASESNKAT